jgi:hypothetical protein
MEKRKALEISSVNASSGSLDYGHILLQCVYSRNKIDALVFKKICVKMCYITLEIVLVCVNMKKVSF